MVYLLFLLNFISKANIKFSISNVGQKIWSLLTPKSDSPNRNTVFMGQPIALLSDPAQFTCFIHYSEKCVFNNVF